MQAKIVLIGDATVGKSTIRERYLGINFRSAYLSTVGADFTAKTQKVGGNFLEIQIWDLAGQQGFSGIRNSFYKGTDGAVIIFDVSNPKTIEGIPTWIKELRSNVNTKVPLVLVGNKIDLRSSNTNSLSYDQGIKLSKKLSLDFKISIQYIESSAKTGENIDIIFSSIANSITEVKSRLKKVIQSPMNFEEYYEELNEHIQLYFFKMMEDGPACVAKTILHSKEELLVKMAIYYSTALGQGASEHTGLFGPFPIPEKNLESGEEREEDYNKEAEQSLIYSFKKADQHLNDVRAQGINFCFIVITTPKDLIYQFNNNSTSRFFYDKLEQIQDTEEITDNFLLQLKKSLLNDVFLVNN